MSYFWPCLNDNDDGMRCASRRTFFLIYFGSARPAASARKYATSRWVFCSLESK